MNLKDRIHQSLLYYDIFSYPLTGDELFIFSPMNSLSKDDFINEARKLSMEDGSPFRYDGGYFFISSREGLIESRKKREKIAKKLWKKAEFMTSVIKMFPFVRAVMITGSLSKGCADENSDLDFMIITSPDRLWITRTLLMLFKKIFLLNSYRYFCVNYLISEDNLEIPDRNIFTATEIATVRIAYNTQTVNKFLLTNSWINEFFPNYRMYNSNCHKPLFKIKDRRSLIQRISEKIFPDNTSKKINRKLMNLTMKYIERKYSYLSEAERKEMFSTEINVSRTHPGNMQRKILEQYKNKLREHNIFPISFNL